MGTISKVSDDNEKLKDELNWYLSLPDDLKVLTPRLVAFSEQAGQIEITQEYYGYPDLGDLFVNGDFPLEVWVAIIEKVLLVHQELRRHQKAYDLHAVEQMYIKKTRSRLNLLRSQDGCWENLLSRESICFNGKVLNNYHTLEDEIGARVRNLRQTSPFTIIHGDYCFSNILFDMSNQIVRLIDPRGRFDEAGIWGDPRYDLAKLRHSAASLYDFIVADRFKITINGERITAEIHKDSIHTRVGPELDRLIQKSGFDLNEVKFIEGLLFISMVPLHQGQIERQLMFYCKGLEILNNQMPNVY